MSGSTRSRQKRKLEPISLEELAGTTGMSGFCTFLTRDSSVAVPVLDQLQSPEPSAPQSSAPAISAPESPASTAIEPSTPISAAPITTALESSAPESIWTSEPNKGAADTGASDSDAPGSPALGIYSSRRIRIREATTVQDGHSLAEQAVYDAMYRAGKPYQGDSRILTIGLRTLAELSRMAYSNCKANVRSLVTKLAIEERPGFSYIEGRTYIVYSFREILRRRKAAGLTHVVRTRGVAFVDPNTANEVTAEYNSSAPDSSAPLLRARSTSAAESISSAPLPAQSSARAAEVSGALDSGALIKNRNLLRNNGKESSSVPAAIVAALHQYSPDVDDDAAFQLWGRCLEQAPDARVEEIVHFIHVKGGRTGIRMPLGFLLTAVPKCFSGEAFRQFRLDRAQAAESTLARDRQFAEEVLKNPEADEEQREWARSVLAQHNQ